jgi:cytochrome bd ubiquinol oxidase subunit I
MFVLGVAGWHLLRRRDTDVFIRAAAIALVVAFLGAVGTAFSGHAQAQVMTRQQPMKMAAAEALWETEVPATAAASRSPC